MTRRPGNTWAHGVRCKTIVPMPSSAYKRALELDPTRSTTRFSLAETYLETERYDEATGNLPGTGAAG